MDNSSVVEVTVRSIAGEVVFGPEKLPRQSLVPHTIARLKDCRPHQKPSLIHEGKVLNPDGVLARHGGRHLWHHIDEGAVSAPADFSSSSVEFTATFAQSLTDDEKRACIAALQQFPDKKHCKAEVHEAALQAFLKLPLAARDDADVMLVAIRKNPLILQHGSFEMRDNHSLVFEAVKMYGLTFQFASSGCRDNPEIVLKALDKNCTALSEAGINVLGNRAVIKKAVKRNPSDASRMSDDLKADRDFVLELVRHNPRCVEFIPEHYKSDTQIGIEAMKGKASYIKYLDKSLRQDPSFAAFSQGGPEPSLEPLPAFPAAAVRKRPAADPDGSAKRSKQ